MEFLLGFAPLLVKIITYFCTDPTEAAKLKLQLQDALTEYQTQKTAGIEANAGANIAVNASADQSNVQMNAQDNSAAIIRTEIGANLYTAYWRPTLMYLFIVIIGVNYLIIPFFHLFFSSLAQFPMPEQMWTLINVGVGIVGGGKSLEKIATTVFDNKKFMDVLQSRMGKLNPQQRNAINDALTAAEQPSEQ